MAAVWAIKTMDRDLSDGGVTVAHWRVRDIETVGDNKYAAGSYGSCSFTPDPSASDFVAYADLTESTVLGWVFAEVNKSEIEASLTAQIAEQKNPTEGEGVPW
jgi:hypothetical protein|tara:strand:+ start:3196 stop:3504 length:309 start_codon:yes stop_codon:yes gene_type:complete